MNRGRAPDVTTSDCVMFTMGRWYQRTRGRITWPKNIDSVSPHVLYTRIYVNMFGAVFISLLKSVNLCESETRRSFYYDICIRLRPFVSVFREICVRERSNVFNNFIHPFHSREIHSKLHSLSYMHKRQLHA